MNDRLDELTGGMAAQDDDQENWNPQHWPEDTETTTNPGASARPSAARRRVPSPSAPPPPTSRARSRA